MSVNAPNRSNHIINGGTIPGRSNQTVYNKTLNGDANKTNQNVGRYTLVSKSKTTRDGSAKGFYHPASHYSQLDTTKRAQSQQHVGRSNSVSGGQNYFNFQAKTYQNGSAQTLPTAAPNKINGHAYPQQNNNNQNLNLPHQQQPKQHQQQQHIARSTEPQHSKSHSVSSTLLLRDPTQLKVGDSYRDPGRSIGGSLSCGQPSPSSTTEESVTTTFSPNSTQTLITNSNRPLWLHQSELALPTDRNESQSDLVAAYKRSESQHISSISDLDHRMKSQTLGGFSSFQQSTRFNSTSSNMLYGAENYGTNENSEDYMNNYSTGPSFRKIQNLHGGGNGSQRRYPSDTTLNTTSRDGAQIYTSGSRPGPVTIPARSRSAQPSPGPSPAASPVGCYRASETNLTTMSGLDRTSRVAKTQKIDLTYSSNKRRNSSPSGGQKLNSFSADGPEDENESHILPSVREIIRQVEAMTQSNAATSTTDISAIGQTHQSQTNLSYQNSNLAQPRKVYGAMNDQNGRGTTGGILRNSGSSLRTPSAPQLRTASYGHGTQYTPIQAKFNAAVSSTPNKVVAPPVPPHGTGRNKPIIGAFTRRIEHTANDTHANSKQDFNSITIAPKKSELLSHLPTDYQKLREAFIEQRREIQRLRKQLAEKDIQINQLQKDIRLYEPWR